VVKQAIDETVQVSGTLAADEEATVALKVSGRIASISVDLASRVERGQAIAQVEATDYRLRVEQAEAALAQARAELGLPATGSDQALDVEGTAIVRQARATLKQAEANLARTQALAKEGLAAGSELERSEAEATRAQSGLQAAIEQVRIREAAVRQRKAELNSARQLLADTVLRSPLDGIVQARLASVGEFLPMGAPIATIVRIDPLRLRLPVPEREAASLKTGQQLTLKIDGDPATYSGTVSRLAPTLDDKSRTLLVEADIKNPGSLRPGSFAHAEIRVGSRPALLVPKAAVVAFAGISKVLTVVDGKAVERPVTTGRTEGDRIEIRSGVKEGDSVVARPGSLQQGQPVRVGASTAQVGKG
jgi:RND family efflux transporter MFP subunit